MADSERFLVFIYKGNMNIYAWCAHAQTRYAVVCSCV